MRRLLFIAFLLTITIVKVSGQPYKIAEVSNREPWNFFNFNDKIYFIASPIENSFNRELWIYDNKIPVSSDNPKMYDVNRNPEVSSSPHFFTEYNGKLFFSTGDSLYSYIDTLPFSETNPRSISSSGIGLTTLNNKLYYSLGMSNIWEYDDNLPINSSTNPKRISRNIMTLTADFAPFVFQGKLFFSAYPTNGNYYEQHLYVYDPEIPSSENNPKRFYTSDLIMPRSFIIYNDKLYFSAGEYRVLWVYDGITPPKKITNVPSGMAGVNNKIVYNDTLYFSAIAQGLGTELWKIDKNDSVSLVKDIWPGQNSSSPSNPIVFGNRMIFLGKDSLHGNEMWCYDNTSPVSDTNPFMIADINTGPDNGVIWHSHKWQYAISGNHLYFGASTNTFLGNGGLWSLSLCDVKALEPTKFTLGNDTTIFIGESLKLMGPSNVDAYHWSDGTTNSSIDFHALSNNVGSNQIILRILDQNGCRYADTIIVTVKVSYCQGNTTFTEQSGTFNDGSNERSYLNNSQCTWLIEPKNAKTININFSEFDIESDKDFVSIYDGVNHRWPLIGQFSGKKAPFTVTATSGRAYIVFSSDSTNNASGWTLNYNTVITNLQENTITETLKIYPNPTNNTLFISSDSDLTIKAEIFNNLGQSVSMIHQIHKGANNINITNLIRGAYYVKFTTNNSYFMRKLIVN